MKLARRSTASLVLTVLALALGFAFSAWCVGLAISIERLRVHIGENVALLHGLEDTRAGLLRLERVVLVPYTRDPPARVAGAALFDEVLSAHPDGDIAFETGTACEL